MQIKTVNKNNVRFNPVTNTFDANVELKTADGVYHYPCAVEGSLMMPLAMAVFKLTQQAKLRHAACDDLRTCSLGSGETEQIALDVAALPLAA